MGELEQRHGGSVTETTRLPVRGQTTIVVTPPLPCGLAGCVAEIVVTIRSTSIRMHLDGQQRAALTAALDGPVADA